MLALPCQYSMPGQRGASKDSVAHSAMTAAVAHRLLILAKCRLFFMRGRCLCLEQRGQRAR